MDIDPTPWAAWLGITAIVVGWVSGLALVIVRDRKALAARLNKQDLAAALTDARVAGIETLLKANFGPNSGGLREQVNLSAAAITALDGKVEDLGDSVNKRLDDHLALHVAR